MNTASVEAGENTMSDDASVLYERDGEVALLMGKTKKMESIS